MTHTLHRRGDAESLTNDIVFMMLPAMAINGKDPDMGKKLYRFMEIGVSNGCISIGNASTGNEYTLGSIDNVLESTTESATVHCVFDDEEKAICMLHDLKEADLGVSIIISGLFDMVGECCKKNDITPHTVEFSLGTWGNIKLLPESRIMEINTMCGHGMVSVNRIKDVSEKVKKGTMTADQGGKELGKTCTCGIFNWKRASEILTKMATIN